MDNPLPLVTDESQSAVAPKPSKIWTLSEPLPPGMSPGSHCSTTGHSRCRERLSVRGLGAENPHVRPPRPVRERRGGESRDVAEVRTLDVAALFYWPVTSPWEELSGDSRSISARLSRRG